MSNKTKRHDGVIQSKADARRKRIRMWAGIASTSGFLFTAFGGLTYLITSSMPAALISGLLPISIIAFGILVAQWV